MSGWTVLYGGELSKDVAQRVVEGTIFLRRRARAVQCHCWSGLHVPDMPVGCEGAKDKSMEITAVDMESFKKLKIDTEVTKIIFILQV